MKTLSPSPAARLAAPVAVAVLSLGLALASAPARADFPVVDLSAGIHRIQAEVAATEDNRQQGLMHRKQMAEHRGMLFVFPRDAEYCMWMRNTLIPLSVAFMDAQGRILNVEDMKPLTEDAHCAAGNARYALEMNQGWFARRKLGKGTAISGIDKAPAPQ